ncbi:hypothetical protein NQ317_018407 [Molorchus minor]|uniref:Uncharacterized protein n=1 Tax=Molorchus minor TaxID=1323400 RepID=A0ABQ9JTX2_9CUCU|nr:hypothetical protein NQ317_018407 [Molorchus minor]
MDELLSTPEGELRLIKVSLDILRQKIEDLKQVDSEIYNLLLDDDASEGDLLAEMEASDSYIKKFTDLNSRCEERMQPKWTDAVENEVASVISNGTVNSRSGRRKFKLPTLEFKKFDGNIKEWLPFWSQFQKVHEDPDIDLNDKVEYLIQAMVPGSRARQLVDSFPATGSNYSKMIDCLLSRFGREDLQIEVYVRELLKLVINNTTSGNKIDLSFLYDKLESQLRALETLGITSDKYAAMLFPLVESCLPSDLLRVWQRLPVPTFTDPTSKCAALQESTAHTAGVSTIENRLKSLMQFLKNEVDNEQHVNLAVEGFDLSNRRNKDFGRGEDKSKRNKEDSPKLYTATGLINSAATNKCLFCQHLHESASCFKAQKLSYDQKKGYFDGKGACFRCLKIGHQSRLCRGRLKCIICGKSHVALMCQELSANRQREGKSDQKNAKEEVVTETHQALANSTNQHSTAEFLRYRTKRQINIIHGLFGGSELSQRHDCYDVTVSNDNYSCTFEALDQPVICNGVSAVFYGVWMEELRLLDIQISDSRDDTPIELLIGADIAGKLYTGKKICPEMRAGGDRNVTRLDFDGQDTPGKTSKLKTWEKQLTWDTPVDPIMETHFRKWMEELPYLSAIRIPRWINAGPEEAEQWNNLHYNEDEINIEKRKKLVTVLLNSESKIMTSDDWHIYYFSQYLKTLRMCAWILRFIHNAINKYDKRKGDLSAEECGKSEILVLKLVQQESFGNENDEKLRGLNAFKDNNGLIRLKTRISNRDDHENFRFPIVLPAKHSLVNRLVFGEHVKLCHVGVQGLMSILRERYWILGGRRAIKAAISGCVVCKRHNAKPFDASSPPLPMDRVRDAAAFETTDAKELVPLTPVTFLRDQITGDVPDCDAVDQQSLSRKVLHRQKLLEDLRKRFRNEYLGQLKWWSKRSKKTQVKVGEVVFVGNDKDKRVNWPLGRVIELLPGSDGRVRLVRVLTERGQFLRPIQRLYPLECATDTSQMDNGGCSDSIEESETPSRDESVCAKAGVSKSRVPESEVRVTRSGRKVTTPVSVKRVVLLRGKGQLGWQTPLPGRPWCASLKHSFAAPPSPPEELRMLSSWGPETSRLNSPWTGKNLISSGPNENHRPDQSTEPQDGYR